MSLPTPLPVPSSPELAQTVDYTGLSELLALIQEQKCEEVQPRDGDIWSFLNFDDEVVPDASADPISVDAAAAPTASVFQATFVSQHSSSPTSSASESSFMMDSAAPIAQHQQPELASTAQTAATMPDPFPADLLSAFAQPGSDLYELLAQTGPITPVSLAQTAAAPMPAPFSAQAAAPVSGVAHWAANIPTVFPLSPPLYAAGKSSTSVQIGAIGLLAPPFELGHQASDLASIAPRADLTPSPVATLKRKLSLESDASELLPPARKRRGRPPKKSSTPILSSPLCRDSSLAPSTPSTDSQSSPLAPARPTATARPSACVPVKFMKEAVDILGMTADEIRSHVAFESLLSVVPSERYEAASAFGARIADNRQKQAEAAARARADKLSLRTSLEAERDEARARADRLEKEVHALRLEVQMLRGMVATTMQPAAAL